MRGKEMEDSSNAGSAPACSDAASEWPVLGIDRGRRGGLVDQIVSAVTDLVRGRKLPASAKMPSVRRFAKCNGISTFTVVEAYDRLVMLGLLSSRRGSGYYVVRGAATHPYQARSEPTALSAVDPLVSDLYSCDSAMLPVGSGWLPPEWHGDALLLDAVRHAMRVPASRLRGYGHPLGFPSLRQHLAQTLSKELLTLQADQIVLTHGATHGFDLILRTLSKPGDHVFVEDPGYSNLLALIRHHGCVPIGIPRNEKGLDFETLERMAAARAPKLMFINTVLHNPLGTSLTHAQAHHLLGIAERVDSWVVEDDVHRELAPRGEASLAAMDGLRRVIRVGSFSKTLSPALRVGSICASASLVPELVRVKMLAGLTTSEINERAVYHAVSGSAYRRMLERLRGQLDSARERTIANLGELGMIPVATPRGGIFVSAGWPRGAASKYNGKRIANLALQAGILLSPNEFFSVGEPDSVWFRFNVAYTDSSLLTDFLKNIRS
jgi:DNA-binding transcriptional MocR family regulator